MHKHIPKSFRILGDRYTVQQRARPGRNFGSFQPARRLVTVHLRAPEGAVRPAADVYYTFWHEAVHAALHHMGHRLWDNEKFVARLASRLCSITETARMPK